MMGRENWAVNVNVHYNKWTSFGKNDLIPVVQAYKDLFDLFTYANCGSQIKLFYDGKTESLVKCRCSKIMWNLEKNNVKK